MVEEEREGKSLKNDWELISDAEAVPQLNTVEEQLSWKQEAKPSLLRAT